MYKRVISGHYSLVPENGELALANDFEAYNLPQGILTNFYRAVAGNKSGGFPRWDWELLPILAYPAAK